MLIPVVIPVYLQIKQLHVQHEMLEKLEKEELVSIRIKASSIQWVKPGKECVVGTEMFDVKCIKQEGDMLVLTGLYDAKEKELKKLAATHSQEQSKQARYCIKLFSLADVTPDYLSPQPQISVIKKSYPSFHKSRYYNPYIGFLKPPPRFV
ncbi:hypothetical protein ESA94_11880 [Lacibacter luteus]|uniref:Uncharacterized protein n=1 Tax=Lacibacter luteus TaxID=2508719 RepID=A0A4Q1CHR0_9BACT|nr:hypothetical protein [Lacibacter luteus]RXK59751.1 hypothetical protein ESA94_11880 [Lacibacter luteus]